MKKLISSLILFTIVTISTSALGRADVSVGVTGGFGAGWSYMNAGTYRFVIERTIVTGANAGDTIYNAIAMAQKFHPEGEAGLFVRVKFTPVYSLKTELAAGINNGVGYMGNYDGSYSNQHPDSSALTGSMTYSWTTLNLNLINEFTIARPTDSISVFALVGPSVTATLGGVEEHFISGRNTYALPPNTINTWPYAGGDNKRTFSPDNRFNVGVIAGWGTKIEAGVGYFTADVRTAWYFVPQTRTYPSAGFAYTLDANNNRVITDNKFVGDKKVFVSKPIQISMGYGIDL